MSRTLFLVVVVVVAVVVALTALTGCLHRPSVAAAPPKPCLIDDDCPAGDTCDRGSDESGARTCTPPRVANRGNTHFGPAPASSTGAAAFGETPRPPAVAPMMPVHAPASDLRPGECRIDSDCTFPNRCVAVQGSMHSVCGEVRGQETSVNPKVSACHVDTDCPAFSRCERLANGDYGCVR